MIGASNGGFASWMEHKRNPSRILVAETRRKVYLRITLIWIQTEGVDCIHVDQHKGPVAGGCGNGIYIYIYIYTYTHTHTQGVS